MESVSPNAVGFSEERVRKIGPALQRFVDQGKVAGVVTLLARQGKVAHLTARGSLDLETGRPMPTDAIFRIYSMTKPVTAVAVTMLYEEGHFLLDDPIANFIPEFAQTKVYAGPSIDGFAVADLARPISIRHLLMHTSGIPYSFDFAPDHPLHALYRDADTMRWDEPLADKMKRMARLPLCHQPGASWTYGMSIDVLGYLVEVVSGERFDAFLAKRLFGPLGMPDTAFNVPAEKASRFASVYTPSENGALKKYDVKYIGDPEPPPFLAGGAGLVSTATDYARFGQMLVNGGQLEGTRILGRKTVELLTASQMTREQIPFVPPDWAFREGYGMALGGRTLIDVAQSGAVGSEGTYTWQGAAGTDFWADPKEQIVGVTMIQTLPGYSRLAQIFRGLAYSALVD